MLNHSQLDTMANLLTITKEVLHNVGKPFDFALQERVKSMFRHIGAKLIKEKIAKSGISQSYIQGYKVNLISVDVADDCQLDGGCSIYRTENKIPQPIDYVSDVPFINVSSINGQIVFQHTTLVNQRNQRFAKFTKKVPMYDWRNNYLYFYNIDRKMRILINAIFKNADQLTSDCSENCYNDNMEFPLSEDMIVTAKDLVYRELGYSKLANDAVEEVKVDTNE